MRADHDLLCYVNADIIFFDDLLDVVRAVASQHRRFLLAGGALDLDVTRELGSTKWGCATSRNGLQARNRVRPAQPQDGISRPPSTGSQASPPRDTATWTLVNAVQSPATGTSQLVTALGLISPSDALRLS